MANVVMMGTGSLICLDCGEMVSNTANYEMRKEGCFSHSHSCGAKVDDKEKFVVTLTSDQRIYLSSMLQTYKQYTESIARMFGFKTANWKPINETEKRFRDLQQAINVLESIVE